MTSRGLQIRWSKEAGSIWNRFIPTDGCFTRMNSSTRRWRRRRRRMIPILTNLFCRHTLLEWTSRLGCLRPQQLSRSRKGWDRASMTSSRSTKLERRISGWSISSEGTVSDWLHSSISGLILMMPGWYIIKLLMQGRYCWCRINTDDAGLIY